MLQSMTGYGKASVDFEDKTITIEIKSLNSKGLDAS
ncbi:MAG: YicC/YloC family endoribonuclease, partial [Bacteroidia bacterium]